jgi:hypothetical protein
MGSKCSHSTFSIYSKHVDILVVLDDVAPPLVKILSILDVDATV